MTEPESPGNPGNDSPAPPWKVQLAFAIGLMVLFVAMVIVMIMSAKDSDAAWKNKVYVFSSVEALVFTAIGWVFGREVHRGEVAAAKDNEAEAKGQASDSADKAAVAAADAAQQRSNVVEMATGIRIAAQSPITVSTVRRGESTDAALGDAVAPAAPTVADASPAFAEVLKIATRLHPQE